MIVWDSFDVGLLVIIKIRQLKLSHICLNIYVREACYGNVFS